MNIKEFYDYLSTCKTNKDLFLVEGVHRFIPVINAMVNKQLIEVRFVKLNAIIKLLQPYSENKEKEVVVFIEKKKSAKEVIAKYYMILII